MAYCVDANTFIEAKNKYYGFDFCPAFWDWLDREAANGNLLCVKSIFDEIAGGSDDLAKWIKLRSAHTWLCKVDALNVQTSFKAIANHVNNRSPAFKPKAISEFLGGADPWLIAYCMTHGHTLVTHEISQPAAIAKVKIPDVCNALGVTWIDAFELLRRLKAQFDLH